MAIKQNLRILSVLLSYFGLILLTSGVVSVKVLWSLQWVQKS